MLEESRNELIDGAEPVSREPKERSGLDRRRFLAGVGAGAAVAVGAGAALAQDMGPVEPPSTVTSPPREFGPEGAPNVYFWDPDVIAVDPSFNGLAQPNAPIQRLWTGALWAEGPAWNGVRASTSSGATSRTTGRCAGSRTTVTCRSSACRRTTATATPSTSRAGRSPASI